MSEETAKNPQKIIKRARTICAKLYNPGKVSSPTATIIINNFIEMISYYIFDRKIYKRILLIPVEQDTTDSSALFKKMSEILAKVRRKRGLQPFH